MNVKLAAQLLSESVAKSLQFCLYNNFREFKGCEATINFITIINYMFDIMDLRNLCSSDFKRPIQKENEQFRDFLSHAELYLRQLKTSMW